MAGRKIRGRHGMKSMEDFIYRHKSAIIATLCSVIALLSAVMIFLIIKGNSLDFGLQESGSGDISSEEPTTDFESSTDESTETTFNIEQSPLKTNKARVWVGESRVAYWIGNQYRKSVSFDPEVDYFIGKGGCNYINFVNGTNVHGVYDGTGFDQLDQWLKTGQVSHVFFLTGINDAADLVAKRKLYNGKDFIHWWADAINGFALAYPDVTFVYGNIGPVIGNYSGASAIISPDELNPAIMQFNSEFRPLLSENIIYVDLHSAYMKNGFVSADGVHYDYPTNEWTYQYLRSIVGY